MPRQFTAAEDKDFSSRLTANKGFAKRSQVDRGSRLTFNEDEEEWEYNQAELEWYINNGKLYESEIAIICRANGDFETLHGAEYLGPLCLAVITGRSAQLWWQQQDAKKRAARQKVADLHKEIRDYLGDPS